MQFASKEWSFNTFWSPVWTIHRSIMELRFTVNLSAIHCSRTAVYIIVKLTNTYVILTNTRVSGSFLFEICWQIKYRLSCFHRNIIISILLKKKKMFNIFMLYEIVTCYFQSRAPTQRSTGSGRKIICAHLLWHEPK